MTDTFHKAIRIAQANPTLQAALDANMERRLAVREQAMTSLPEDFETMRQRLHEVKTRTIARLDEYLEQFVARAQANGMIVHHAADATQATRIVLEICQQKNARLVAKSKSMVSEEIELNHALESAGLRVVETDLGEYIVQLRHEKPAHIISPAVHLRRDDVGRLFQEKLGTPYTEDIPTLVAIARETLRQVFLDTDVGISGVNVGVAETGTLCIVTNEGNARMVTTLPRLHIALMGIERLVPTLADLALVLHLLPRSATGQKNSVYNTLINGPRRPGDPDGPQERHLILVDNGRSALRGTPLEEALLCIRCGACLNACPVYREMGGHAYVSQRGEISPYPGPIGSILAPGLLSQSEFGHLARASSLCGACKEICPAGIDLPKLLLRVRAGGKKIETQHTPEKVPVFLAAGLRFFTWIATRPGWFHMAQKLAGLTSSLASLGGSWLRLPAFSGWGYSKDFPCPADRPFRELWPAVLDSQAGIPTREPPAPREITGDQPVIPVSTLTESLVERFEAELTALGGDFSMCAEGELARRLVEFLRKRKIEALQAWEAAYLPGDGHKLLDALKEAGIRVMHQADPSIKAGLTGASAGIAASGTLLLPGGAGRPLAASLLPEIHLAVVHSDQMLPNLEQALALMEVRESAALALVTGPSRTADIEMALTIGVHGPKEIHVFCVENQGRGYP